MQKKFSLKTNRLAKTIVYSGSILIIVAFVIIRYEGFLAIFSKVMNIFRPVIIGCVIAFALNRPMNFFHVKYRRLFAVIKNAFRKKKHIRKIRLASGKPPFLAACITTYILTIAVLAGIICFIVPQITNSITLFTENFRSYADNFIAFIESNKFNISSLLDADFFGQKIDLNEIMDKIQTKLSSITEYIPTVLEKTYNITSGIISGTIDIVLGVVFSIYILLDKQSLKKNAKAITRMVLKEEKFNRFERIIRLAYNTFANFISGQLMEAVILGVLCFIGMSIFGFDYAPLISVIIGITNMIPIAGPIIGTIPGALILLLVNPIRAVWFVVFIIVIQQIDSNLIYPKVVGNSIGLPALWVLFAITVGGGLGGVLGMVLGVPIVSIIYTLVNEKIQKNEKPKTVTEK